MTITSIDYGHSWASSSPWAGSSGRVLPPLSTSDLWVSAPCRARPAPSPGIASLHEAGVGGLSVSPLCPWCPRCRARRELLGEEFLDEGTRAQICFQAVCGAPASLCLSPVHRGPRRQGSSCSLTTVPAVLSRAGGWVGQLLCGFTALLGDGRGPGPRRRVCGRGCREPLFAS